MKSSFYLTIFIQNHNSKFSKRMTVLTLQVFLLLCLGNFVFAWNPEILEIIKCGCGKSITGANIATGRIINGIEV